MSSTIQLDPRYRHFVAIYRCDIVSSSPFVAVCGNAKIELFRENRTYPPSEYRNAVVGAIQGAEYCIPVLPPIELDTRNQHLVLTTRTRLHRRQAQPTCERDLDRVIALLSAFSSPELFRILLFRGWLRGPRGGDLGPLLKAIKPLELLGKDVSREYVAASKSVAEIPDLRERFALMSRFIAKGLAEPPSEEAFIWLWTALEVFPMIDTTDIRPISEFLSSYVGQPSNILKEKLRIGWLFGMRSKIVHEGHLPLAESDRHRALKSLEDLVRAVVRHAAGLPYDGAFDALLK